VPSSITFQEDLAAQGKLVEGDSTQLHQVILNLCTNASHAMRGSAGHLMIRLNPCLLPDTPCAMNILLPAGEYLCLEVADTGKGIDPAHLDQIFLPFFTTKSAGEGTGLGLSVSHGIVSNLGGGIQVTSALGEGTTFKVFLPVATATLAEPEKEPEEPLRGEGRILLVDDEESLLQMLNASLVRMGFQVSSFNQPRLALQAFRQAPGSFRALVTDHTMPGMSGVELAQAIWELNPAFPVILLSGTPDHGQTGVPIGTVGFRACLAKPMSPRDIAKAILKALPGNDQPAQETRP
jgi:CheY-like chemotaxis protein